MSKKKNTVLSSLNREKKRLEARIKRLLKEKETISEKMEHIKLKKIVDDLKHEKAELEERIESLEREKADVIQQIELTKIIGALRCPKNYHCYRTKYKELCKAELVGKLKIVHCLEEDSQGCIFSLLYKDAYYCQCPLRNYIAEKIER
jgi:seryl-tRNA synthetase